MVGVGCGAGCGARCGGGERVGAVAGGGHLEAHHARADKGVLLVELDDEAQVVVQVGRALDRAWASEPRRRGGRGRERAAECVGSSGRAGRAEGGRLAARVRGRGRRSAAALRRGAAAAV